MIRWVERQFNFDLPVWLFPNLVERLSGTPARVEEIVKLAPPHFLTRRDEEHWSIQENIGHLLDLEPLWLGRVDDIISGKAYLREADLTNRKTHEAQHNAKSIEEILRSFRAARMQLVWCVEVFGEEDIEKTAIHPRLGQPMRIVDLLYFVVEHDDHHLAQVRQSWRKFERQEEQTGTGLPARPATPR